MVTPLLPNLRPNNQTVVVQHLEASLALVKVTKNDEIYTRWKVQAKWGIVVLVVKIRISNRITTLVKNPQQLKKLKVPSITAKSSIELSRILSVVVQARTLKQAPVNRLLTRLLVKAKRKTKKRNTRSTTIVSTKLRTGKIAHVLLRNKACQEMNELSLMKTMVREPSSLSEGPILVHITVALRRSVRDTRHQLKSLPTTKTLRATPTIVMKTKLGLRINLIITQVARRHRLPQMNTTLDSNRKMKRAKRIRSTRLRTNLN